MIPNHESGVFQVQPRVPIPLDLRVMCAEAICTRPSHMRKVVALTTATFSEISIGRRCFGSSGDEEHYVYAVLQQTARLVAGVSRDVFDSLNGNRSLRLA